MNQHHVQNTLISTEEYRAVMRHQASTVTIVACGSPGSRLGLTATAACSLSDNPPTVMVCINRNARAHDAILKQECFSLNFLSADQVDLAKIFSGKSELHGEDRFGEGAWITLSTGAPVLEKSMMSVDCQLRSRHEFDTHSIFAGEVRAARAYRTKSPLLYFHGSYFDLNAGAIE
ncbi:MAG: flavin reductase [Rhizobiales bacterium]|nr:flavin reductase [Hyphomicrobiales bacterium]